MTFFLDNVDHFGTLKWPFVAIFYHSDHSVFFGELSSPGGQNWASNGLQAMMKLSLSQPTLV